MQTVAPRSHPENWSAQFGCCHWFLCLFARTSHTAFTFKSVESDPHEFTCVILTCAVVECWLVAFDASEICSIWSASSHQCMWDRNCWGPLLVVKRKIDWNYWLDVSFIYLSQSYRIRSRKNCFEQMTIEEKRPIIRLRRNRTSKNIFRLIYLDFFHSN